MFYECCVYSAELLGSTQEMYQKLVKSEIYSVYACLHQASKIYAFFIYQKLKWFLACWKPEPGLSCFLSKILQRYSSGEKKRSRCLIYCYRRTDEIGSKCGLWIWFVWISWIMDIRSFFHMMSHVVLFTLSVLLQFCCVEMRI